MWTLRGRYWYGPDSSGNMARVTAMTVTTPENARLSDDFLSLMLMCASKHKTSTTNDAVRGLIMDNIRSSDDSVNYDSLSLVQSGKGIEVFQQCITTGF